MRLTILGSGSAFASAVRGPAGYVVSDGDTQLIVDAGSGTLGRACRAGIEPGRTTGIAITHLHPDHVSDLIPLLFEIKHRNDDRERDVLVYGPTHFAEAFDQLMFVFGSWCVGERYDVRAVEIQTERVQVGSLQLNAFPVVHGVPANGYRVTDAAGRVIAFTADTELHEAVVDGVRGADLLVADATTAAPDRLSGHMNAEDAGELARRAGVKKLILSHLSEETNEIDVCAQAATRFSGAIVRAEDLLAVDL